MHKNLHKHSLPYYILTLAGAAWIIVSIFLLTRHNSMNMATSLLLGPRHCQTCTTTVLSTIVFLTFTFSIGGLAIGYGITHRENNTTQENRGSQLKRTVFFAFAVSLASLVLYYWVNLFINGLT